jgi:hypothetical protein
MDLKGSLASRSAREPHEARRDLTVPSKLGRRREGLRGQSFFLAGEFALRARTLLFAQRPLQIAFHEAPLGPIHGRATNAYAGRDIICSVEVEEK